MYFVWTSKEEEVIFLLYGNKGLVYISYTRLVYFAVRNESLNGIQIKFILQIVKHKFKVLLLWHSNRFWLRWDQYSIF
jgi:hypothetical protein